MIRYALTSLRANLTRLIATALAVVIGITFLASGLMLTDAMRAGLTGDVEQQFANVDLAVSSEGGTGDFGLLGVIPTDAVESILEVPGVAGAAGEVQASATVRRPDGTRANLRSQGRAWIEDEQLNPLDIVEGAAPSAADEVALDRRLAAQAYAAIGDRVTLETPAGPREATVSGLTSFGDQDALDDGGTISFPVATAVEVLNAGIEGYSRVLVRTDGDPELVADELRRVLPSTLEVDSREQLIEDETAFAAAFVSILRPILQGFAYLAMFVCAFVIFNTFSVVVTQRFRELALIRAVGGTPAQVRRSLLIEGTGIGVLASAFGIACGAALTVAVQWVLDRFALGLPSGRLQLSVWTVVLCMVVGTVVTVLSVAVPAFRAGRTKPVEAMRDSAVDTSGSSTVRAVIGGGFLVLALVLLLANRFVGAQWFYLAPGGLLLFAGVFIGGPLLARLFAKATTPLLGVFGLTGRLAGDNSVRNPKRTATTANALVIGLFLVTLVTVSGEAVKSYIVTEVNKLSSSDFLLAAERSIDPALIDQVEATEGVSGVAALRSGVTLDDTGTPVLFATTDLERLGEVAGMAPIGGSLESVLDGSGIAVPDLSVFGTDGSGRAPLRLGESIVVRGVDGEQRTLTVDALLDEAGFDSLLVGNLVSESTFEQLVGDQPINFAFIRIDPGTADDVGRRLDAALEGYTGVEVLPGNFVGQIIGDVFDFLIGAVNALLGMSVVVALVGIVNTMTLAIFERRRELGMVRALGMTGQQVGSMIRLEAVLIGLLGTIVGMASGIFLSWVVVSSIEDGIIDLALNWTRIGAIFAVGVAVGVVASLLPARRASRLDMLEAMRS